MSEEQGSTCHILEKRHFLMANLLTIILFVLVPKYKVYTKLRIFKHNQVSILPLNCVSGRLERAESSCEGSCNQFLFQLFILLHRFMRCVNLNSNDHNDNQIIIAQVHAFRQEEQSLCCLCPAVSILALTFFFI